MPEPSFKLAKDNLESHLKKLICQPVREFQERWGVVIDEITIDLKLCNSDYNTSVDSVNVNTLVRF